MSPVYSGSAHRNTPTEALKPAMNVMPFLLGSPQGYRTCLTGRGTDWTPGRCTGFQMSTANIFKLTHYPISGSGLVCFFRGIEFGPSLAIGELIGGSRA